LHEAALDAGKIGRLARVLAHPIFAPLAEAVRGLQTWNSFTMLRRVLDGENENLAAARSVLVRAIVGNGQALDELPRVAALSAEGRQFLETPGPAGHVGDGCLDLYMACAQISPAEWKTQQLDLRLLLRGVVPVPGEVPTAKAMYTDAWRGLWRMVNLLQYLRGFHVEIEGLDTLSPPVMTADADSPDGGPDGRAWIEALALCEEKFHPLINAIVAAGVPGPDCLGDDVVVEGRVVGMMEFGWSGSRVAVVVEAPVETSWTMVAFDPDVDAIGETVTKILQALEGANP
jgi:DEAD/DEAH box helicase domain-containing protein